MILRNPIHDDSEVNGYFRTPSLSDLRIPVWRLFTDTVLRLSPVTWGSGTRIVETILLLTLLTYSP